MDCIEVEAHLPLFCGGDLEAPLADQVGDHLRACDACGALLDAAHRARAALLGLAATSGLDPLGVFPLDPELDLWPGVRAGLVEAGLIGASAGMALRSSVLDGSGLVGSPLTPSNSLAAAPRGRLLSFPRVASRVAGAVAAAVVLGFLSLRLLAPDGGPLSPVSSGTGLEGLGPNATAALGAGQPARSAAPAGWVAAPGATLVAGQPELLVPLIEAASHRTPAVSPVAFSANEPADDGRPASAAARALGRPALGGLRPLALGDELLRERALLFQEGPTVYRPAQNRGQGAGWSLASDGVLHWR